MIDMLTVITGPMFSGKSIELIRQVNRQKIAGKRVIVFKFSKDNRYSQTEASSYDGMSTWAIPVTTSEDIIARVELSRSLEGQGQAREALRVLEEARASDPKNVEVLFRAAELNQSLNNKTAAIDNLALVLCQHPNRRAAQSAGRCGCPDRLAAQCRRGIRPGCRLARSRQAGIHQATPAAGRRAAP